MKTITDAKAVRIDVHSAKIECDELSPGAVHFVLDSGESFTMSAQALNKLVAFADRWGGALVEVSPRDERIIGKGVVRTEDYPK